VCVCVCVCVCVSLLSTFYGSKQIAVGHLNRSEDALKCHGDVRHLGNIAHVGSGVGGCRVFEGLQPSSQD